AAASLTPRVRLMAICDGVRESQTESEVFNLKGVRQRIVASAFPHIPGRLWLCLVLSSPRPGEFPAYVRVLQAESDKAIFYAQVNPRPTFQGTDETWITWIPIRSSFPEEGQYTVQIWFFQEQGSDVLKGEVPFSVLGVSNP